MRHKSVLKAVKTAFSHRRVIELLQQAVQDSSPLSFGVFQDRVQEPVQGTGKFVLGFPPAASNGLGLLVWGGGLDDLLQPERQTDALQQLHVNETRVLLLNVLRRKNY